ncbi:MAG: mechanosensitive ion channel family protein [Nitrososphaerota archaeon]|nr:mechanosensitive ion channel family protein [Nitrososphaerota archaeon]MDG6942332.1 mechanosensitive ion channel family protein [Nitrososphaerota archaeon]MDG6942798.1 mechanosensitive ion channel family protein [Nitrososphaerota archaeon]MDG6948585.1 mechanosensitive ion channel family protein [Nitrososphaerota archaeon]MDG6950511.1 mechanosensitive ion channel family protein [Nitrososphaerota archaeon]
MEGSRNSYRQKLVEALVVIIAAFVLLYFVVYFARDLPINGLVLIKVVVAIVAGYLAIGIVANEIRRGVSKTSGRERGATVAIAFRFIGYIGLAFVALALAGVTGTELLAGGTVTGLVAGLASQQTLSNMFAGLLILTSRPFLVGNRITISTWQWGFDIPSYPPKFFSDNLLIPGYTGVVEDIRLNYTTLRLDEGVQVKVPNSIVIQASVLDHGVKERLVRVRYDILKPVDTAALATMLHEVVAKNAFVTKPDAVSVYFENITPTDVIVLIEAFCAGAYEAPARSSILLDIEKATAELRESQRSKKQPTEQ